MLVLIDNLNFMYISEDGNEHRALSSNRTEAAWGKMGRVENARNADSWMWMSMAT